MGERETEEYAIAPKSKGGLAGMFGLASGGDTFNINIHGVTSIDQASIGPLAELIGAYIMQKKRSL